MWSDWNFIIGGGEDAQNFMKGESYSPSSMTRSLNRAERYSNMHSPGALHWGLRGAEIAFPIELNANEFILKEQRDPFSLKKVSLRAIFIFSFGLLYTFFRFSDMNIHYFCNHLFENELCKSEVSEDTGTLPPRGQNFVLKNAYNADFPVITTTLALWNDCLHRGTDEALWDQVFYIFVATKMQCYIDTVSIYKTPPVHVPMCAHVVKALTTASSF